MGRKAPQQPAEGDTHETGGSRFRRKLSYGLAFISNPLAQRKTTPGRHGGSNVALTVDAPGPMTSAVTVASSAAHSSTCHRQSPASPVNSGVTASQKDLRKTLARDSSPTTLPRSQTTSFIPRPVRIESSASTTAFSNTPNIQAPAPSARPSKIPTPSPPLSVRRRSSPRAYVLHCQSPQQSQSLASKPHQKSANAGAVAPATLKIRSQTTPNLMNATQSPSPTNRISARKPVLERPAALASTSRQSTLQENAPLDRRITQTRSRLQESSLRREELAARTSVTYRNSLGTGTPLRKSKISNRGTPLTARRQLSSNLAPQTPATSKSVSSTLRADTRFSGTTMAGNADSVTQSRLMGPLNAPTPAPTTIDHVPVASALPRSSTETDLQRKTLGKSNGLGGIWRSSRALAAANPEVKDYMPPSYWAGRFQSRFDQWRTEALTVELNPKHRTVGLLAQCRLDQEKMAACYIFAQLRDLCLNDEAADSLWEFEYNYRKDNKLLDDPNCPLQPPRKQQDQAAPRGAFEKVVRKLTPRKPSFINLLKGKGKGKDDEEKPSEAFGQSNEGQQT